MNRFTRRYRAGSVMLTSALLGLGGAAGLVSTPQAQADATHEFTCRASVARVQGKALPIGTIEPFTANPNNDPCRTGSGGLLNVPIGTTGDHVSVVSAQTVDTEFPNDPSKATADARVVEAQVGGALLRASVLTAHSEGNDPDGFCGPTPPTFSGDSHVVSVSLNGNPIEVPTAKSSPSSPTLTIPGVATLWLREEFGSSSTGFTERALELQTPLADVVISEAKTGMSATQPSCGVPCPDEENPNVADPDETNPMVDPTAEETMGKHPDCAEEFSEPMGDGDNTAHDFVHFTRSIEDTETSPNGSFEPMNSEDSRNRFNGKAGFFEDGDTMPSIEGDFYDDEDMNFRLAPLTIDAYYAPDDRADSPWRRFCGTGVIMPFGDDSYDTDVMPAEPFAAGQERKYMVETFDAKWLNDDNPGGDQSDYWVIDIYAPGSDFDTQACDPAPGDRDHDAETNPYRDQLDYHSEGQTIAGNIEIHSERVADNDNDDTTSS